MKPTDKRLDFPFGANLSLLERLRKDGLTIRLDGNGGLLVSPREAITPAIADEIKKNKQRLLDDLDLEAKGDAMGKLPFVEFEKAPVQMREAYLFKGLDGEYLAMTRGEAAMLGWSDTDNQAGGGRSGKRWLGG